MEHLRAQLEDLPNEILLIILKQLNTIDLFKLKDLNRRIHNILYDEVMTSNLTLFKFDNELSNLLPEIDYKIKSLNVELFSIEYIFPATTYPNLYKLGLYNVDENGAFLLQGKKFDI